MHVKGKVKRYTLSHFPLKTTRENFFPREKKLGKFISYNKGKQNKTSVF